MRHDTNRNHGQGSAPSAADFSNAIPRGNVLRATEPVVAPVIPAGTYTPDRARSGRLDADSRRVIDDPSMSSDAGAASGMGATTGGAGSGLSGTSGTYAPAGTGDTYPVGGARDRDLDGRDDRTGEPTYGVAGASVGNRIDDAPAARPSRMRTVEGVRDRRFSIGATFLGWAVASFFSLVFTVLVLAIIGGGAAGVGGDQIGIVGGDPQVLGVTAFIGVLVAMFLGYLIGGYAAGRIAHWDGAKHGAGVPVWTILFGLLALLAGAFLGPEISVLVAPALPAFDVGAVSTYAVLGVILMLAVDFAGAILGGILGARGDQRYEAGALERRRIYRGRPL